MIDLENIRDQEDRFLKVVSLQTSLEVDELPLNVDMEGTNICLTMIGRESDLFGEKIICLKISAIMVMRIGIMELLLLVVDLV